MQNGQILEFRFRNETVMKTDLQYSRQLKDKGKNITAANRG